MASTSTSTTVRLLICTTCLRSGERQAAAAALSDALAQIGIQESVAVEFGGCMHACSDPVAIGLQGKGGAGYVFAGLDPVQNAEDIARTCQAYMDANKGWIVDAQACGKLRLKLRARLPGWR